MAKKSETVEIEVKVKGLFMSKLQQTLASKRFQLFVLSVLVAIGATLTGDLSTADMWAQLRENGAIYLGSIVAVQAPVEMAQAFRGDPKK